MPKGVRDRRLRGILMIVILGIEVGVIWLIWTNIMGILWTKVLITVLLGAAMREAWKAFR